MKLEPLTLNRCEQVRQWRNQDLSPWRTPYLLTDKIQEYFYESIVCNRDAPHRYWALTDNDNFVAMGGITNIQWENSIGEITLITNSDFRYKGYGEQSADLILDQAFNYMNLKTVFGECYFSNVAIDFWKKITKKYNGWETILPNRKFWDGKFWDALYFSISKDKFNGKNE